MAILKKFKQDSTAINTGEWIVVGEEFDDLEILTKGLTDAYFDIQAAKLRQAARAYQNNVDRIPQAIRRRITAECLVSQVFMDVRNLFHDDAKTQPVTKEQFANLLLDPDYAELLVAVMRAAGKVGQQHTEALEEAVGNLSRPSEPTSTDRPAPLNG